MNNKQYFYLTLGPVQGFVAQARRSRDYWAGSFILSWLAGVAILSVKAQHGKISFPIPDKNFLNAIKQGNETVNAPKQGGIPNRFKAEGLSVEVDSDFSPELVVADIKHAWQALAEVVWQADLAHFFDGENYNKEHAREIWDRQISGFWDISWVLTDDKLVTNLLDRRKNWRTHYQSEEFGSKCMMMDGYQELSGTVQPHIAKSGVFWSELRQANTIKSATVDFNEGEQLCALAYVKRRFARFFGKLQVTLPSGLTVNGWQFNRDQHANSPIHIPSLPYLAALPWIANVAQKARDEEANKITKSFNIFASHASEAFGLPSSNVHFNALEHIENEEWRGLDGMSFFPEILLNDKAYKTDKETQKTKDNTAQAFYALQKATGIPAPFPFYALLIMDGDGLGKQMSDVNKQHDISNALNDFTNKVQKVVTDENGFLIYAGGDDVLALLPMEYALDCAIAVKKCYDECFKGKKAKSTISAGIQYAHIKTPLMKIIKDAHSLLDDVAKDQTGRDSLAIRIHKPGGLHAQWSMPWEPLLKHDALKKVVNALRKTDNITMTNGWLMRSFDLINSLLDRKGNLVIDECALRALTVQEYIHSGTLSGNSSQQKENASQQVKQLLTLCQKEKRISDAGETYRSKPNGYQPDAIKVVRFLATKGVQD